MEGGVHIDKDLVAASATPLVLAILAEGESYGYAILKRVRALSGGELEWTDGMLYPLLHRLRRLGYVTTEWRTPPEGRRRQYYMITDDGRAALADQQRQWVAVTRALNDVWPGSGGAADGARRGVSDGERGVTDRRVAGVRRKRPGGQRPRRRRARGSSPPPDRRAERGRPHGRRGVPDRRETDGRHRRPVPGVRARAQRPTVEAARPREPTTSRRARPAAGSRRSSSRRLRRSRSRSRASPPASPTRNRPGSRGTSACSCLPFLAAYFARRRQLDVRRWVLTAAPFVLAALVVNLYPYDADSDTEMLVALHLPVVLWFVGRLPVHGRHDPIARAAHGLRPLHGRVVHLLRADRARGRRAHGADRRDPRAHRGRRRPDRRVGAAFGSGGRRDRGRVARRVEAAGRGEHGAGAHDALHAAVRGDAGRRRRRLRRDRARRRVRPRAPQRLRRPAGGRPRARPVRDVRAGAVHVARTGWTASSWSPSSAPSCST